MVERDEVRNTAEQQRRYRYKAVQLLSPEEAQQVGIPAEAPVLVSPYADRHVCPDCGAAYSKLVYAPGETTTAQHFHRADGGIYHCTGRHRDDLGGMATESGWLLELAVLGRRYDGKGLGRAERVAVAGVRAFCTLCAAAVAEDRWDEAEAPTIELRAGLVADVGRRQLEPVCSLERHGDAVPEAAVRYVFRIEAGCVLFRAPAPGRYDHRLG